MTKAKLQLLRGLLSEIMQLLPPAKRKLIDAAINEIDEGVGVQTTPEQREVAAKRNTTKDEAHSNTANKTSPNVRGNLATPRFSHGSCDRIVSWER